MHAVLRSLSTFTYYFPIYMSVVYMRKSDVTKDILNILIIIDGWNVFLIGNNFLLILRINYACAHTWIFVEIVFFYNKQTKTIRFTLNLFHLKIIVSLAVQSVYHRSFRQPQQLIRWRWLHFYQMLMPMTVRLSRA